MKAHGFSGVFRLSILIGAVAFHSASAATPPEQNAQTTPSPQERQVNQPNKTKNKQNTNAHSALKEKQSNNSQPLGSNAQRKDADSRREVESPGSERHQEKAALIATGVSAVLNAIRKPAPSPPPPPVVAKTTAAEQKNTPHKRTHPKSIDDDVWSRINPVSK